MKTSKWIVGIAALTSVNSFAAINVDCGTGYGPTADNLAVTLDDEDSARVDQIGYEVVGSFFELRLRGCSSLSASGGKLLCDGRPIGSVGKSKLADDDGMENGPRASVQLSSSFDITGSCGRPKDPLTITIAK